MILVENLHISLAADECQTAPAGGSRLEGTFRVTAKKVRSETNMLGGHPVN
jgi:hypothetical protein